MVQPELLVNISYITYAATAIVFVVLLNVVLSGRGPNLDAIPTVGSGSGWLGSWWAGFKRMTKFADAIQEGCEKYKNAPFKVSQLGYWIVVLSRREDVEELFRAPDDVISLKEARVEQLNVMYTLGPELVKTNYHITVIRLQLTRNIGALYHEMRDEMIASLDEVLDLKGKEWKSVPVLDSFRNVVCRTSNRVFVGLPLCRDPDWVNLNIQFTIDVVKEGIAIGLFPKFIKPLVAIFIARGSRRGLARGLKLARPTIEDRLKERDGMPRDFLSWLMEEAKDPTNVSLLVAHVLLVNFAAIHTTATSITNTLFYLAAHPQYIQPLREEVESIVEKEGWSKDSLGKMNRIDSFLRECQRLDGTNSLGILRKALKDIVLSDGTLIPKGAFIGVATRVMNCSDISYRNGKAFEPFRFVDMYKDGSDEQSQFVSPGINYLPFGYGKRACPGRFLAANELKSMLAHIVMTYDIRLDDGEIGSHSLHHDTVIAANPDSRLSFRKRVG